MFLLSFIFSLILLEYWGGRNLVGLWRRKGWAENLDLSLFKNRFYFHLKGELENHFLYKHLHRSYYQSNGTFSPQTVFDPRLGWRFPKSTRVCLDRHSQSNLKEIPEGSGIYTDENGLIPNDYRQNINLLKNDPEKKRIFLIGGSAPAGLGSFKKNNLHSIENHQTIAAVAERMVNERSAQKIELVNACVHGYSSVNELIYYNTELLYYPHDQVIAFHGYNDAIRALFLNPSSLYGDHCDTPANRLNWDLPIIKIIQKMRIGEKENTVSQFLSLAWNCFTHSTSFILWKFVGQEIKQGYIQSLKITVEFFHPIYKRLKRFLKESGMIADIKLEKTDLENKPLEKKSLLSSEQTSKIEDYVKRQFSNDISLAAICAAHGHPYTVVLQPFLITKQHLDPYEKAFMPKKEVSLALFKRYLSFQKEYYQNNREKIQKLGAACIDFTHILDDFKDQMYNDVIHYSENGIIEISKKLSEEILKTINQKRHL